MINQLLQKLKHSSDSRENGNLKIDQQMIFTSSNFAREKNRSLATFVKFLAFYRKVQNVTMLSSADLSFALVHAAPTATTQAESA